MAAPPRRSKSSPPAPGTRAGSYVAAATFKTTCLELLNRVRETGADYIVTKHGTPVARVVPYRVDKRTGLFFGAMKGSVIRYDGPFDPIDGHYDINDR